MPYLVECQSIPGPDIRPFGWMANTPDGFFAGLDKNLLSYKPTVATVQVINVYYGHPHIPIGACHMGMATVKMPGTEVLNLFDAELARVPKAALPKKYGAGIK